MKKPFAIITIIFSLFLLPTQAHANNVLESIMGGVIISAVGCPSPDNPNALPISKTQCNQTGMKAGLENWVGGIDANATGVSYRQGAAQTLGFLIDDMYKNPPASAGYYVADLIKNSGFAPQAYAQGVGFGSLSAVLPVWKAFRNITYFLMAIIFVVMGFAIMLRAKLNPQTVISIQTAIPKLVVTLLLITFSYAIAGLMIDLMYLSTYLAAGAFNGLVENNLDIAFDRSVFMNSLSLITNGGTFNAANSIGGAVTDVIDLGDGLGQVINNIFKGILTVLTMLVIAIAILVGMFRTFFMLLSTYVQIILAVCFAPFHILMNAMPGSNSFMNWLKTLAGNLAVFPALVVVILLAHTFTNQGTISFNENGGFSPPQLPGRGSPGTMAGLIGLAMILMMPEVGNKVKAAFGAGGQGGKGGGGGMFGGMLGAGLAGALAPGLAPLKMAHGFAKNSALGKAAEAASGEDKPFKALRKGIGGGLSGYLNPIGYSYNRAKENKEARKSQQKYFEVQNRNALAAEEKRKTEENARNEALSKKTTPSGKSGGFPYELSGGAGTDTKHVETDGNFSKEN